MTIPFQTRAGSGPEKSVFFDFQIKNHGQSKLKPSAALK